MDHKKAPNYLLAAIISFLCWMLIVAPLGASPVTTYTSAEYRLNKFFGSILADAGLSYEKPTFIMVKVGEEYNGECGIARNTDAEKFEFLAFYCPPDQTVVMESDFAYHMATDVDDFMPYFVMAHEYAHHFQHQIGFQRIHTIPADPEFNRLYTIELELMADCLAGAWTGSMAVDGSLDLSDIAGVLYGIGMFGSKSATPGSHGTAQQRVQATLVGYTKGVVGCVAINPLPRIA